MPVIETALTRLHNGPDDRAGAVLDFPCMERHCHAAAPARRGV